MNKLKMIDEKLDEILNRKKSFVDSTVTELKYLNKKLEQRADDYADTINKLNNTLVEKDKLISDIIHNIYSHDTSLQLVVMKPYRGKTVVYKDGKRLDTENTTGVDVCIDELGHVDATIRNE